MASCGAGRDISHWFLNAAQHPSPGFGTKTALFDFMFKIRTALPLLAVTGLVSCTHVPPSLTYQPVTKPEEIEFCKDTPTVYPDQVRQHLSLYTNTPVIWVGIIRSTDAQEEDTSSKIRLDTVFEHHYFDWRQQGDEKDLTLRVSGRGEGRFRARWYVHRTTKYMDSDEVEAGDAEKFAGPGKLAVFYGVPQSVDPDGTIVLKYHYVRLLPQKDYTTNGIDYGRVISTFRPLASIKKFSH